jgi:hypothetical protein
MTQEDKDLLLKDLCARLPYGVKICYIYNGEECISTIEKIDTFGYIWDNYNGCYHVREIKPYLLPLSSMTEEQKKEFELLFDLNYASAYSQELQIAANMIKWLNKNHFDIYGLIPMGLVNDATGLNIY